jgi:hypothetical protein
MQGVNSLGRKVEMLPLMSKMMYWCSSGARRKRVSVECGASFVSGPVYMTYPRWLNGRKCFVGG